jgi:ssDNA-binding Zn-finger/Zn-ribbon topoisomerase 1
MDVVFGLEVLSRVLFVGCTGFPCHKILWKAQVCLKCRFLLWPHVPLKLTAHRLGRHGLLSHGTCPMCSQEQETAEHRQDNFEVSLLIGMAMALPSPLRQTPWRSGG